jgi:type VI protein secretion system component Hcp
MKNLRGTVVLALVLFATPCFAAVDAFIWFDKVKGESTDAAHKDWVEISSFSWGMTNPTASVTAAHPAAVQGCATNEIRFAVRGSAAPQLVKLAAQGAHFAPVRLDINGQRHVLEGATISSCQNNLNPNDNRLSSANCVMKFQRCSTHANTAVNASMVNPNLTLTQPNGQIQLGNNSDTLTIIAVRQAGPNNVTVSARGASPTLSQHCAQGKHYDRVTLSCRKAGGTQTEYLTFTMTNVLVSSYQVNGDGTVAIGLKYAMGDGSVRAFQDLR